MTEEVRIGGRVYGSDRTVAKGEGAEDHRSTI